MNRAKPMISSDRRSILIIALVLLSLSIPVIGVVSYKILQQGVDTLTELARPDKYKLALQEVEVGLFQAESAIRKFVITRDSADLSMIGQSKSAISASLNGLTQSGNFSDTSILIIDSIIILVDAKFKLLEKIAALRYNRFESIFQGIENQFSSQIDSIPDTMLVPERVDGKKLRNKKKKIALLQAQANQQLDEERIRMQGMQQQIFDLQTVQLREESQQRFEELELADEDVYITDQIDELIRKVESQEEAYSATIAKRQAAESSKYKRAIALACILASVLLLSLALAIWQNMRRSKLYNVALKRTMALERKLIYSRESFLANMSHEMRTPLHVIGGFIAQLKLEVLSVKSKEYTDIIAKSSKHLLQLINDLLDHAKLESGKLNLVHASFDYQEMLKEVYALTKSGAEEKGLILTLETDNNNLPWIQGDELRIRQILLNLVSNALKFTETGNVIIRVKSKIEGNSNNLSFAIVDSGIGIPEDRLAHIFNQFEQADELISHNYGGTGLGLTISKNLAEDMGGSLQVESEAGKGAKFTFSVNLPVAEPVRSSGSTEVIGALPTATILVADDEPYNRKLIGAMLENFGQNVLFAENGKQAVEIFKSNFDKGNGIGLLLFDIRMPEMNGANALTAIRAIQDDIEAVALTASLRAGEEDQYIAMGFQDALGKPFDPQQLKKILHTYLPNKKSESKNKVQAMDSKQEDKLDLSGLLATGDNAFVKEMLSLFIEQTENGKLELKQAVKAGNFEDASMCAHRMTGPIRHMGLISLADLMRDFEARIKESAPHKELISSAEGIDLKLAAVIDMAKQYAV